ncbi:hypothetical protein ANN_22288 [Periplaneta americana]|uniref:Uncharacterized protein n=1 Tax=Periplaneta americana TaxID=6978 RepID=A0ABQ8S7P8_PERAM|nr:hypothetical protein ANN_22288 [Periplaneta americana]
MHGWQACTADIRLTCDSPSMYHYCAALPVGKDPDITVPFSPFYASSQLCMSSSRLSARLDNGAYDTRRLVHRHGLRKKFGRLVMQLLHISYYFSYHRPVLPVYDSVVDSIDLEITALCMNQEGQAFKYVREKFPKLSDAKVKEGIFVGPQIRELVKDPAFDQVLEGKEKEAWEALKGVIHGFLGNKRDDNYTQLVTMLLQKYHQLGCNMSLKIHFLHSHLAVGMKQCLRIIAGLCVGLLRNSLTRGKLKDDNLMKPHMILFRPSHLSGILP